MHVVLDIIVLLGKLIFFYFEALFRKIVPPSKKSVRGKVVVITGGAGGLGRCLALKFAGLGAKVAVWDINKSLNENTAMNISSLGGKAKAIVCDVTDRQSVRNAASLTRSELGEVDIIVNNAGIMPCRRLLDLSEEEIKRTININTTSHFWTVREFLPHMLAQNEGHIVTVASMASKAGIPLLTDYCASKHGAYGFAEAVKAEMHMLGSKNIHNTTICPMQINTNLVTCLGDRIDYRNR
ncbi:hypothetical protein CAPTEDRAFT_137084 [Capitella teleta]|uniref:Short-chain dehydrogenase/reductase 3 n=1 Tax=Capitella teleta TaxID=283909 RepID=R7UQE0_CAPTE|nr:hypothetical protein CAPTEDRAFT_137084 [Capitella teleta]|eukprot:ELU06142.1 hypothetical protein CAPTEDRAFT_137084 [Capitella teleta]